MPNVIHVFAFHSWLSYRLSRSPDRSTFRHRSTSGHHCHTSRFPVTIGFACILEPSAIAEDSRALDLRRRATLTNDEQEGQERFTFIDSSSDAHRWTNRSWPVRCVPVIERHGVRPRCQRLDGPVRATECLGIENKHECSNGVSCSVLPQISGLQCAYAFSRR